MTATTIDLHALVQSLKEQRDHIRVRLHLAKAEAKDEWEKLEHKWEHVRSKMDLIGREAGEAAQEVGAALQLTVDELRLGYEQIIRLL